MAHVCVDAGLDGVVAVAGQDANCVGVSCEYALSSEEREAECQVIAAMRSVA